MFVMGDFDHGKQFCAEMKLVLHCFRMARQIGDLQFYLLGLCRIKETYRKQQNHLMYEYVKVMFETK